MHDKKLNILNESFQYDLKKMVVKTKSAKLCFLSKSAFCKVC